MRSGDRRRTRSALDVGWTTPAWKPVGTWGTVLLAAGLSGWLGGCASFDQETVTSALAPGKARVILARTNETLHATTPATTKVNGSKVADVPVGATQVVDIAPGASQLTVEAWAYPGSYTIPLEVRAGETVKVEISPRPAQGASAMLGPIGGLVDKDDKGNGGAFTARQVAHLDIAPAANGASPPGATVR